MGSRGIIRGITGRITTSTGMRGESSRGTRIRVGTEEDPRGKGERSTVGITIGRRNTMSLNLVTGVSLRSRGSSRSLRRRDRGMRREGGDRIRGS